MVAEQIQAAVTNGKLIASAQKNIQALLGAGDSEINRRSVEELVEHGAWDELNDRFYKTLAFGTGGLRGRTIGKIVTKAERGSAPQDQPPEFPCVGTNAMNFFNVRRATRGLAEYVQDWRAKSGGSSESRPTIVIAHDPRHFSRAFAELAAAVATENGCDAALFDGPRSTPELSFAVRYLNAGAGIVITASHNPPHDNGYKVYFDDGAQVVEPHASGIIARVNAAAGTGSVPSGAKGEVRHIGAEIDDAYLARLETLVLDREIIKKAKDLRIIFTPIHGTGAITTKPLLERFGFDFQIVPEQREFDGNFPTVKSPNPENAEALTLGIELAKKENADIVVATDPDGDRLGVACRGSSGEMELLTGNQIGSVMTWYRLKTLFDQGILTSENAGRAVVIKTFVTSNLQNAIAGHFGVRCIDTLTGFKYNGAKLRKYEQELGLGGAYRTLSQEDSRRLRLEKSSFYVFGSEESYGYSAADFVRDKDGNAAVLMFCEVAAYAKTRGLSMGQLLDEIFAQFGYYEEKNQSLYFEGAEGAVKIQRLLETYVSQPPQEMLNSRVVKVQNFEKDRILDVEGDEIPKEKMLIFELANRTRVAVRGSGTEPKIKYYMFAHEKPASGRFSKEELAAVKQKIGNHLTQLWSWIEQDAMERIDRTRR